MSSLRSAGRYVAEDPRLPKPGIFQSIGGVRIRLCLAVEPWRTQRAEPYASERRYWVAVASCCYINDQAFMPTATVARYARSPSGPLPCAPRGNHPLYRCVIPSCVWSSTPRRRPCRNRDLCCIRCAPGFRHEAFLNVKVILHGSSSGAEAHRGSRGDSYESVGVLPNARSRASAPHDQVAQW